MTNSHIDLNRATEEQAYDLSRLFIDCGFTLIERRAFLKTRLEREIVFLDQLTRQEADAIITELRDLKKRKSSNTDTQEEQNN